jgi:glutamine---fructose-6-phosphate transaminase (isomerizing)
MCQLVAYIGDRPIAPLMLKALELQEPYFAAHATGLGTLNNGKISIVKASGHVAKVKRKVPEIKKLKGRAGIGHSRYSNLARDDPRMNTDEMVHPFTSDDGKLALMHNGEIHNYMDHYARLKTKHTFKSYAKDVDFLVDSEVAVHILSDYLKEGLGVGEALQLIAPQLTGTFLLSAVNAEEPETVWIANWHQPCVLGIGDNESIFVSSHVGLTPIKEELKKIWEPPMNSLIKLTPGNAEVKTLDPKRKPPEVKLNKKLLKEEILNVVSKGDVDFRNLYYCLLWNSWSRVYGLDKKEWDTIWKQGFMNINPFISVLNELISENKIRQYVDRRLEGQTKDTPRFTYSLVK